MTRFRVATFNIRHGRGRDDKVDIERTAAVITALDPDLIALQELDRGHARSQGMDQPARLAELTGLEVAFFPTVARDSWDYGIALGSRTPLEHAEFVGLPRAGPEEPRGAIVARFRGLGVVATHLSWRPRSVLMQTEAAMGLASAIPGPLVVLGDFNQGRRRLKSLLPPGFEPGPALTTWFGGRRRGRLDYVLCGPGTTLERAWTSGAGASDHLCLAADIRTLGFLE